MKEGLHHQTTQVRDQHNSPSLPAIPCQAPSRKYLLHKVREDTALSETSEPGGHGKNSPMTGWQVAEPGTGCPVSRRTDSAYDSEVNTLNGRDGTGRDGTGRDGTGRTRRDVTGRDRRGGTNGRYGTERSGTVRDRQGWTGRDGMGHTEHDGTG